MEVAPGMITLGAQALVHVGHQSCGCPILHVSPVCGWWDSRAGADSAAECISHREARQATVKSCHKSPSPSPPSPGLPAPHSDSRWGRPR